MLLADSDPEEAAGLVPMADEMWSPWPDVLGGETTAPYFEALRDFVSDERKRHAGWIFPQPRDVFAAFRLTPYEKVRVVILGQDPYPTPGHAQGLAFSVPRGVAKPASLHSIDAALVHDGYPPLPQGDLTNWAKQGVLLLNTALTVRQDSPGKGEHPRRWRPFTNAVVRAVSDRPGPPVVFVLWGGHARSRNRLIDSRHHVITAPHPTSWEPHRRTFQTRGCFAEVNSLIDGAPIEWSTA